MTPIKPFLRRSKAGIRRIRRNERGQAITEFALVLPVLLLLICGIVDFGRLIYDHMEMNLAAQETVRKGGLGRNDVEMRTFAEDYLGMDETSPLHIQITPPDTQRDSGDYVTVSLRRPFRFVTPFASLFIPSDFGVESQSTIRVE